MSKSPSGPSSTSTKANAPTSTKSIPPIHRLAALAAAEARLRGDPAPPDENDASSSSPQSKEEVWKVPSEKEDKEVRLKFARLLDRGVVRDNGYRQSAVAVETLSKIASNILLNSRESKYRTLKATNASLKNKVLAVKGGHDYLIALGFRTQTVDFTLLYVLEPTMRRMHELMLGAEVLDEHLDDLRKRASSLSSSASYHKSDEAERKARALREIEADRSLVKERVERERIAREARERAAKEAVTPDDAALENEGEQQATSESEGDAKDDEDGKEEEAMDGDEGYGAFHGMGGGRKLRE